MESNGEFSSGMNGKWTSNSTSINLRTPEVSLENWSTLNCAEPKALDPLLLKGYERADISQITYGIRRNQYNLEGLNYISGAYRSIFLKAPCNNCMITQKD